MKWEKSSLEDLFQQMRKKKTDAVHYSITALLLLQGIPELGSILKHNDYEWLLFDH